MPNAKFADKRSKRPVVKSKAVADKSSKQRLSRFGKKQKKGTAGNSVKYLTRTQAIKKLQITLRDFRRLCILKGIYPRVPKKKRASSNQSYYHVKDIAYLAHEPILQKFWDLKAFMKKIRRAAGKGNVGDARRLAAQRPKYRLDHLIRERYPRFPDAVADLDDALCMLYLFASLPADKPIESERVATASRLVKEWEFYVARSRSLRKVFFSVKGTYFQADIQGIPVTWLAPYKFSMPLPSDVDYRIMLTFLELHEVLVKFSLYKLYNSIGLSYPPTIREDADALGMHLGAIEAQPRDGGVKRRALPSSSSPAAMAGSMTETSRSNQESVNQALQSLGTRAMEDEEDEDDEVADTEAGGESKSGPGAVRGVPAQQRISWEDSEDDEGEDDDEELEAMDEVFGREEDGAVAEARAERKRTKQLTRLFKGLVFFLNREVPRETFQFIVRAFRGRVGWQGEGSPIQEDDPRITHHVIDRPTVPDRIPGREFVQPQWIADSINARVRLPVKRYRPGQSLPPHLSPFIDDAKEGYIPEYRRELDRLQAAAAGQAEADAAAADEESASVDESDSEDETGKSHQEQLALEAQGRSYSNQVGDDEESDDSDDEEESDGDETEEEGDEDDEDDEDEEEEEDTKEPARKRRAIPAKKSSSVPSRRANGPPAEAEKADLRAAMLTGKKRKEYNVVQRSLRRSKNWVNRLETKRQALQSAQSDPPEKRGGKKRSRQ